eukprot:TRINITY_DN56164_c0_g1_i1.p1 TRINITY_DN56164_c0_g1~~TRINITY_DN56164_c0_g1_i1.p1  ORF type:complete len:108 (+),score=3.14 TRINITY_DN56164_c0_g1_i1:313-636(+)
MTKASSQHAESGGFEVSNGPYLPYSGSVFNTMRSAALHTKCMDGNEFGIKEDILIRWVYPTRHSPGWLAVMMHFGAGWNVAANAHGSAHTQQRHSVVGLCFPVLCYK